MTLLRAEVLWDEVADRTAYPFAIPAVAAIESLDLSAPVTFLVGDNGSGKSTLLEAIAEAALSLHGQLKASGRCRLSLIRETCRR